MVGKLIEPYATHFSALELGTRHGQVLMLGSWEAELARLSEPIVRIDKWSICRG